MAEVRDGHADGCVSKTVVSELVEAVTSRRNGTKGNDEIPG